MNHPDSAAAPGPCRRALSAGVAGYTLADVDRLARQAARQLLHPCGGTDPNEAYAAAWHAIVERVYTSDQLPPQAHLVRAERLAAIGHTRTRFLGLWHQGETPSRLWRREYLLSPADRQSYTTRPTLRDHTGRYAQPEMSA